MQKFRRQKKKKQSSKYSYAAPCVCVHSIYFAISSANETIVTKTSRVFPAYGLSLH